MLERIRALYTHPKCLVISLSAQQGSQIAGFGPSLNGIAERRRNQQMGEDGGGRGAQKIGNIRDDGIVPPSSRCLRGEGGRSSANYHEEQKIIILIKTMQHYNILDMTERHRATSPPSPSARLGRRAFEIWNCSLMPELCPPFFVGFLKPNRRWERRGFLRADLDTFVKRGFETKAVAKTRLGK